jgi:predicted nuclease of restriction endonuclease-like (RecB) superfamily
MMNLSGTSTTLVAEIQAILSAARSKAVTAVNFAMVEAYWQMGKRIVEEEQSGAAKAQYGEGMMEMLSKALIKEFGKGFSVANLKNFRQFYLTFPTEAIRYALRSELTWTHYRLIMRVENPQARQYYITECANQNWSTRTLERNLSTLYYERLLSSKQIPATPPAQPPSSAQAVQLSTQDFIKDPYVFEFLNIPQPHSANEQTLERALINHLQHFLLELGKGFSFVGRQFRISTETSHFFIELVFYNYILKCFVLFDLKTTKLQHQDIGQMDMYIRMFDALKKRPDDNPTIGIILCADKDETMVKYSMLNGNEQMFASQYRLYLPTEAELKQLLESDRIVFGLSQADQDEL